LDRSQAIRQLPDHYSILVGVVAFIMINAAIEYRLLCNQTRRVPTVLREKGYRFFFYMADRYEPPHIHVAKQDTRA
jgi:hypothetical protein